MNRRGFLGRLLAAPAALYTVNAIDCTPATAVLPTVLPTQFHSPVFTQAGVYRFIQAGTPIREGQAVCFAEDGVAGVACVDIDAGNYGYMQIRGLRMMNLQ